MQARASISDGEAREVCKAQTWRAELRERNGLAGAVGKSEVGNTLADLRSAGGARHSASADEKRDGTGAQHRGKNGETRERQGEPSEPSRGEVEERDDVGEDG